MHCDGGQQLVSDLFVGSWWSSFSLKLFHYLLLLSVLFSFSSVPDNLITSATLSPANPIGTVGSSIDLNCMAVLSEDVSGAIIEFEYGFIASKMITADSGTSYTDTATIDTVNIFSTGPYTCKVTVTAPGVCGPQPACPTNSDSISLTVQCEW